MAVHDIRYYLNGILFIAEGRTLTLVATDGHRLALAPPRWKPTMPSKQEVILPRKTVLELQRLLKDEDAPSRCALPGNQAQVPVLRHGVRHQARRRQVPRLQPRHPQEPPNAVVLGRAPLLACLQRAAILTSEKFRACASTSNPACCASPAPTPSRKKPGRARGRLQRRRHRDRLQRHLPHRRAGQRFSPEMVKIELQDGNASALFTLPDQTGFKYVVMPMRI